MNQIKYFSVLIMFFVLVNGEKPFHPTPDRTYDMKHSIIDIYVNLQDKYVEGKVTHLLLILANEADSILLNSKDTDIFSVAVNGEKINTFEKTPNFLTIHFGRYYTHGQEISVSIDYIATPKLGCYFVQPDSAYPRKHFQAWTQGEQMDNQHWVPIYDYPNDKATFECIITVDNPFVAVSNGALISESKLNGKHRFHWKESFPMVSYLISFVVGEYQQINEGKNPVSISYWVYPEHDRYDALRSFGDTPEMLTVFNDYTGFSYPYEKYDQIIVEDFMWGGMENITLSHMADRTMHPESAVPNHSSEGLVAHELAHQWYGDLITTRNWANIWLNEGITSFMELVWMEHKYGYDEKEYYRLREVRSARYASYKNKPMVFFNYEDSNDLFDGNVYAKGAVVMDLLRDVLGDEPFQKGLQHYTKENAYKNVESYDLKKALEETTGKNLYWFFDQWVYTQGLPKLKVSHQFSRKRSGTTITVEQTQDVTQSSVFRLPFTVLIDDGEVQRFSDELTQVKQEFFFPSEKPKMVVFDEGFQIPKFIKHKKSDNELTYQLFNAPNVNDRIWAAEQMGKKSLSNVYSKSLLYSLETDEFWGVRKESASALSKLKLKNKDAILISLFKSELDDRVRSEIVKILKYSKNESTIKFLIEIVLKEQNEYIVRSAVNTLSKSNKDSLMSLIEFILERESHNDIVIKSAIDKLSEIESDSNYERLLELSSYGGTTWSARPNAVRGLEKYIKKHPTILDKMTHFIEDPNYRVRWEALEIICKYGGKNELEKMLEFTNNDPLTKMELSSAKRYIKKRIKKWNIYPGAKKVSKKTLSEIYGKMETNS